MYVTPIARLAAVNARIVPPRTPIVGSVRKCASVPKTDRRATWKNKEEVVQCKGTRDKMKLFSEHRIAPGS